jgi:hypothetical protein
MIRKRYSVLALVQLLIGAPFLALLLGCSTTPFGYTKEEWNHYKADNPKSADLLEWVVKDSTRNRTRTALIYEVTKFNHDHFDVENRDMVDRRIIEQAAGCRGAGIDLLQNTIDEIQHEIKEDRADLSSCDDDIRIPQYKELIQVQEETLNILQGKREP